MHWRIPFGKKKIPFDEEDWDTEEELAEFLLEKFPEDAVGQIFDRYPVKCVDMQKLEKDKLDGLVEKLDAAKDSKIKAVVELIRYVRSISEPAEDCQPMVDRVKRVLLENWESDLSALQIADQVGVSMYYMLHSFKKMTGITVTEFKNGLKLKKAKKLLVHSDKNMTQIALECGFCDASYFSKLFVRKEQITPSGYRRLMQGMSREKQSQGEKKMGEIVNKVTNICGESHLEIPEGILARPEDEQLFQMLPHMKLLSGLCVKELEVKKEIPVYEVSYPSKEYQFLHEAAIIEYHGILFAAWYNNERIELQGRTPIRYAVSKDQGLSWSEPMVIADDPTGEIMYCPPVFGIHEDRLYLVLNQMVKPDHIHSLDLYVYEVEKEQFVQLWSRPMAFKLNTNVYELSNGKLMLPGRLGELDHFHNIPGLAIADNGKIDTKWRIVNIQKDCVLPDGSQYVHPELSAIVDGETIYMFCRDDERNIPLFYLSADNGEHWSGPYSHDIPFSNSKIYSGTLKDGRNYLIGNIQPERSKLAIFFSKPGTMEFDKGFFLQDGVNDVLGYGTRWHYPVAYESDGKLYVIYTVSVDTNNRRGAVLSVIDLKEV